MMRFATSVVALMLMATPLIGQAPNAEPRFEVASIKFESGIRTGSVSGGCQTEVRHCAG